MARKVRVQSPGAMYHVMNRGSARADFADDNDRQRFLASLSEVCAKTQWQIHAFCLKTWKRGQASISPRHSLDPTHQYERCRLDPFDEDSFTKVYDPNWFFAQRPVRDTLQPLSTLTWFTDGALPGWLGVGAWPDPSHAAPNLHDEPVGGVSGTWPQTWPIRYCDYHDDIYDPYVLRDWTLFLFRISKPEFRNLYIGSHMTAHSIAFLPDFQLLSAVQQSGSHHRFHFVFLDGCESGAAPSLSAVFGFDNTEWAVGAPIEYYQGSQSPQRPRKRPGGGVVFRKSFDFFVPTPLDWTWAGHIPEEFAQFYMNFQANWTIGSEDVGRALRDARTVAQGYPTGLIEPPWRTGCADTIGYWYLHHNEFNANSATW